MKWVVSSEEQTALDRTWVPDNMTGSGLQAERS